MTQSAKNNLRFIISISVLTSLAVAGCGVFIGNPKSPNEGDDGTVDVSMGGEFFAEGPGVQLNLLESNYDLYCRTLGKEAKDCQLDIEMEGNKGTFKNSCAGFADEPFTCFVRNNEITLATTQFESGTSLQTNGGDLNLNWKYDTKGGFSAAEINTETSTAAISEFSTADLPSFTSKWIGTCQSDEALGLDCTGEKAEDFYVSLYDITAGDHRYVSMWWDSESYDRCIAPTGEVDPKFFVDYADSRFDFDIKTVDNFKFGIDAFYSSLEASVKNDVRLISDQRISDDIAICASGKDLEYLEAGSCDVEGAGYYTGLFRIQADQIRRTVSRFFRHPIAEIEGYCKSQVKTGFTFDDCSKEGAPFLCDQLDSVLPVLGMKTSVGKLIVDSTIKVPAFYELSIANVFCPNTSTEFIAARSADEDLNHAQYVKECQVEFLLANTSAYDQAKNISLLTGVWLPGISIIACKRDAADQVRKDLFAAIESSCMPTVDYEQFCEIDGTCKTELRCSGSKDGSCYNEDGVYQADIMGREGVLRLTSTGEKSFDMSNLFLYSWLQWDSDNQVTTQCHYVEKMVINGRMDSESAFSGIFSKDSGQYCDNEEVKPFEGGNHRSMIFEKAD